MQDTASCTVHSFLLTRWGEQEYFEACIELPYSLCDFIDFSDSLVSITPETLRHVEGTIILHMRYSIMKDMELGREFIKLLKVIDYVLI